MTLTEMIATLGPVAGVALFMWMNRRPDKAEKPDPAVAKMEAMVAILAQISTDIAILKDRGEHR